MRGIGIIRARGITAEVGMAHDGMSSYIDILFVKFRVF